MRVRQFSGRGGGRDNTDRERVRGPLGATFNVDDREIQSPSSEQVGICGGFGAGGAPDISRWQARSAQPPDLGWFCFSSPGGASERTTSTAFSDSPTPLRGSEMITHLCRWLRAFALATG